MVCVHVCELCWRLLGLAQALSVHLTIDFHDRLNKTYESSDGILLYSMSAVSLQ